MRHETAEANTSAGSSKINDVLYSPDSKDAHDYAASVASEASSENTQEAEKDNDEATEKKGPAKKNQVKGKGTGKRARTLLTLEQSRVLHELLQQTCFPSTQVREAVAAKLGLSPRKVQVFFQNKRQKQRKRASMNNSQRTTPTPQQVPIPRYHPPSLTAMESAPQESEKTTNSVYSDMPASRKAPYIESTVYSPNNTNETVVSKPYYPQEYSAHPLPWTGRVAEKRRPWPLYRHHHHPYASEYARRRVEHRPSFFSRAFEAHNSSSSYSPASSYHHIYANRKHPVSTESMGTLPPIASNIRSSQSKLPGIDELISKAQA